MSLSKCLMLAFLTFWYCTASLIALTKGLLSESASHLVHNENDIDRNENSTPRSFVLPATPAVTEEQAQKTKRLMAEIKGHECLSALEKVGYRVRGPDGSISRALMEEAFMSFQERQHLITTGVLDKRTKERLGC